MFAPNMPISVSCMFSKVQQSLSIYTQRLLFSRLGSLCILILLNMLIVGNASGQEITTEKARQVTSDTVYVKDSAKNDLLLDLFDNDTLEVEFAYYGNLNIIYPLDDTLLEPQLRQIDIARQRSPQFLTLGNIGSPALSPLIKPIERDVFEMGNHGHDIYTVTFDNFKFFRPKTPYTHVRFGTTTGVRDDNIFSGKLSRKFAKNLTGNLEYSRINQVGDFKRDRARNTNLGVGFEQSHWKNRYKTHLLYTYNQYFREENGGIVNDSSLTIKGFAGNRLSVPVFLDEAGSKIKSWGILLNNDVALLQRGDSITRLTSTKGVHLGYEISYLQENGLFYDTDSKNGFQDSVYYRGVNNDVRGIRNSYFHKNFKNSVYLSVNGGGNPNNNRSINFLKVGLTYERHKIEYLPVDSSFSLLKLFGKGQWDLADVAGIEASGYYLLNSLKPIFNIEGKVKGKFKTVIDAEAWLQIMNLPPEFLYENFHINSVPVYQKDADNIFHTYFGGRVHIPFLNLGASLHQNIVNNYTYYDDAWVMQQITEATSVTGLSVNHKLKLGAFHFDNDVLWQRSSSDKIRIPTWATNHAVYLESRFFKKKLLINAGIDVRYLSPFERQGYSPVIFNFYNPKNAISSDLFAYDVFISYKVRLLRGFVRADNINALYDKKGLYQIDKYPMDGFAIRLGFDWMFNN